MAISYTKLWKLLIEKELTKTDLLQLTGISSRTLSKLSKNENVTTDTISRICEALHCDVGDIMEYSEGKTNMTLYNHFCKSGVVSFKGENYQISSFTADNRRYTVYTTVKKASHSSHINCRPDGTIFLEQLYPFGGMCTPRSEKSFFLKPETEPGVITIVVISGTPGLIKGLDDGCCKSHLGRLEKTNDFYVMSEAAFKLFDTGRIPEKL